MPTTQPSTIADKRVARLTVASGGGPAAQACASSWGLGCRGRAGGRLSPLISPNPGPILGLPSRGSQVAVLDEPRDELGEPLALDVEVVGGPNGPANMRRLRTRMHGHGFGVRPRREYRSTRALRWPQSRPARRSSGRLLRSVGWAVWMLPARFLFRALRRFGSVESPEPARWPPAAGKGAIRCQRSPSPTWAHHAPWSTP
jgi:hypothetical protein